MAPSLLALVAAAALTAAFSAVAGMGGGIALLGVMSLLLPAADVVPMHGVVQLGSNFTRTVAFFRHADWRIVPRFGLGSALGMGLATSLWAGGDLAWFKPAIGVFILCFLVYRRNKPKLRGLPMWSFLPVGFVAGGLGLLVGATGPFIAPFFLRDDLDKEAVVATKAACQTLGHIFKLPAFLWLGYDYLDRPWLWLALLGAVVLGTLLGKRVLGTLSRKQFERLFEGVLAAIALGLIVRALL